MKKGAVRDAGPPFVRVQVRRSPPCRGRALHVAAAEGLHPGEAGLDLLAVDVGRDEAVVLQQLGHRLVQVADRQVQLAGPLVRVLVDGELGPGAGQARGAQAGVRRRRGRRRSASGWPGCSGTRSRRTPRSRRCQRRRPWAGRPPAAACAICFSLSRSMPMMFSSGQYVARRVDSPLSHFEPFSVIFGCSAPLSLNASSRLSCSRPRFSVGQLGLAAVLLVVLGCAPSPRCGR